METRLLQLSDSHLFRQPGTRLLGVDTEASLRAVVDLAKAEEPVDAILATGDLSQDASVASYARFVDIAAALRAPVYWIPGNHDDSGCFHRPGSDFPLPARKTIDIGAWRIVPLDSVVPGQDYGRLAQSELEYLQEMLSGSDGRHCLVVLHHQPIATGADWLDTMQLENSREFLDILKRHAAAKAVIYGHIHQDFDRNVDGIRFLGAPSTCFQFRPQSNGFALDDRLPGYRMLILGASGQVETEVRRVVDFDMSHDDGAAGY